MNTIKRIVLPCLVATLVVPAISWAQARPWHLGVSVGLADANHDRLDEAIQIQGSAGYDMWRGSWGVLTGELGAGTTVGGGEIDTPFGSPEWEVTTVGLFATYRMTDVVFYPLARVGYQYSDYSADIRVGPFPRGDGDSGLAAGIGAGLSLTEELALEVSWTRQFTFFEEDLDIIAVGVQF